MCIIHKCWILDRKHGLSWPIIFPLISYPVSLNIFKHLFTNIWSWKTCISHIYTAYSQSVIRVDSYPLIQTLESRQWKASGLKMFVQRHIFQRLEDFFFFYCNIYCALVQPPLEWLQRGTASGTVKPWPWISLPSLVCTLSRGDWKIQSWPIA